jgi:outer membrane immunogenic protein
MKCTRGLVTLIALASISGAAAAQSVGGGFYGGINLGGASNTTCNTWQASSSLIHNPAILNALNNRNCPKQSTFVGGAQIGYNFQYGDWVWGFGADYDAWGSKTKNSSYTYNPTTAPVIPTGTYSFYGKANPNGFFILGPRVGYSLDNWLPYVRVGGVFTSGSNTGSASFTPTGATTPTASFTGSKNSKSSGSGIGAGFEAKIADQCSLGAEYTHVSLGKSNSSVSSCQGTASACSGFANIQLQNFHNSFTASVVRVLINYEF